MSDTKSPAGMPSGSIRLHLTLVSSQALVAALTMLEQLERAMHALQSHQRPDFAVIDSAYAALVSARENQQRANEKLDEIYRAVALTRPLPAQTPVLGAGAHDDIRVH